MSDLPAFGGADLDILYLTTASNQLDPETLPLQPQAGGIFALDVGIKGVAEARFKTNNKRRMSGLVPTLSPQNAR
ncbi:MAG: hypothetical protein U1F68_10705 [Gammaproteobacteria bacterium]